jgi:hypothetical protein
MQDDVVTQALISVIEVSVHQRNEISSLKAAIGMLRSSLLDQRQANKFDFLLQSDANRSLETLRQKDGMTQKLLSALESLRAL